MGAAPGGDPGEGRAPGKRRGSQLADESLTKRRSEGDSVGEEQVKSSQVKSSQVKLT